MPSTTVKERPILFSGEMVRAILDGKKTQTRRLAKLNETLFRGPEAYPGVGADAVAELAEAAKSAAIKVCPYGSVGERLWVRETFRETYDIDDRPVMEYRAGGTRLILGKSIQHGEHRCTSILPPWRPSIHMPRWASRLTLEITDVRVQRLQELSDDDVLAEAPPVPVTRDHRVLWRLSGKFPPSDYWPVKTFDEFKALPNWEAWVHRSHFASLWESINGAGSWEANRRVWCISFRPLAPTAKG